MTLVNYKGRRQSVNQSKLEAWKNVCERDINGLV